jgi:hypothetical protein
VQTKRTVPFLLFPAIRLGHIKCLPEWCITVVCFFLASNV